MAPPLVVRIRSFSFKTDRPSDGSGHGGGFVFDMRCLPNPGRDPAFHSRTGRDSEVRDFLEADTQVRRFRDNVFAVVDQAIENYLERQFDSLTVDFGCTGGQHRSVFFAECLARHLSEVFPLNVQVNLDHPELRRKNLLLESEGATL